jgi:hypothetical protein
MAVPNIFSAGNQIQSAQVNADFVACVLIDGSQKMTADFLPNTGALYDLGATGARWVDLWLSGNATIAGDCSIGGKLTVTGGIDPTYVQIDPQMTEPDVSQINKIWVDANDSYKLKFKDNSSVTHTLAFTGASVVGVLGIGMGTWYLKSYPNTPALSAEFVECNGQTLSMVGSPYNGQIIPDLNGSLSGVKRFLRGSTTSGTTGGADNFSWSHSHSVNYSSASRCNGSSGAVVSISGTDTQGGTQSLLPTYYEVVEVLRVI